MGSRSSTERLFLWRKFERAIGFFDRTYEMLKSDIKNLIHKGPIALIMAKLEELSKGVKLKGILPNTTVTVVDVSKCGNDAVTVVYRNDGNGRLEDQVIYRSDEQNLEIVDQKYSWRFNADGALFRLVSEALRIDFAHLFDPFLAIHTSKVEPYPHQITAVYEEMLPRQPLRFLLADDPGAGKTIMAGLLIKELIMRGDLQRCLIVVPGNLVIQWKEELKDKFELYFEILSNDHIKTTLTENVFEKMPLVIARVDKLKRDKSSQEKKLQENIKSIEWDLIICDEAHKMSASFFGGEVKETKRYKLGKILSDSETTRHFLLMTATPHNGKEEDFQLFMGLLDRDRFEGKFRNGVHYADTSDMMRRMLKEDLVDLEGKPLLPERLSYSLAYHLSHLEALLYKEVTEYVEKEFNRADKLKGRKTSIGFALTILQRRLASSPRAIYQSLQGRRDRLENKLRQKEDLLKTLTCLDSEDLEDLPVVEIENLEDEFVDQATAASTIAELLGETQQTSGNFAEEKQQVEKLAMEAVMAAERKLGFQPRDVSADKCGYDIESRIPGTNRLRFIEVKGRIRGASTVTVTKNEIITALNKPDSYILALVEVSESTQLSLNNCTVRYVQRPFQQKPDFAVTSVNYSWSELWSRATLV